MSALADEADLTLGAMTLRPSTCELVHAGGVEMVEPQVMRVLLAMAREPGRVLSRDTIVEKGWDGRSISEDAINRVLSRMRRLSEKTGVFDLTTIRKVGYRLDPIEGPADDGRVDSAGSAAPPTEVRRRMGRIFVAFAIIAFLAAAGATLLARFGPQSVLTAIGSPGPSLAVSLVPQSPADQTATSALDRQMRTTLSQMRGLRLIGDAAVRAPGTDMILKGVVGHVGDRQVIDLTLIDGRSGIRLWGALLDGRATSNPTSQERAVSAAARYLAVRLGDRLAGIAAAREPVNPEVERLVTRARRSLAASNAARHKRDWALFQRLSASAYADSSRALEMDARAAGAIMVQYQLESSPQYPRPGETRAAFETRLERASGDLARAVAAGPDDPEVLVAAAEDYRLGMRWDDTQRMLERAVAIDPNSADANTWYAYHLNLMGQCAEGLKHARIAAGLAPNDTWRQLAVPRLLHCAGRRAEAGAAYQDLLARDRANVFVLRELYLMRLAERNAPALRRLASHVRGGLWRGAPPPATAAVLARADAGARAIEGHPEALLQLADADHETYLRIPADTRRFGRTHGDAWFVLALEYAHAGAPGQALAALREAVDLGSLYLPWAMPHGPTEFPPSVNKAPAYDAIWKSSPGLTNLINRRAQAKRQLP